MVKHPRIIAFVAAAAVLAVVGVAGPALSDRGGRQMKADLIGLEEVPAVSSTGTGELLVRIVDDGTLDYTLSYQDLEGTVTAAAHIHLGQRSVNGGVIAFLCFVPARVRVQV